MIEVRIHGRGGQGAVIASLLIAHSAHCKGYHVQVFPEFGVERRGVPVTAFARMDTKPILLRTKIARPDHVMILDPAIAKYLPVTAGLKENGCIVMNAADEKALEQFRNGWKPAWVDGTSIAARHKIGTATAPIVNTAMVGAFAAVTGLFGLDEIKKAMEANFPGAADRNYAAAEEAYREVRLMPSQATEAMKELYSGGHR